MLSFRVLSNSDINQIKCLKLPLLIEASSSMGTSSRRPFKAIPWRPQYSTARSIEAMHYLFWLTTAADVCVIDLSMKRKEVNDFIKQQCLTNHLCFIDNENINLRMLNKSGLRINENGAKWFVNNFCFSMTKWHETICLDRPTTTTEVFL